jgi:hypothetical protein
MVSGSSPVVAHMMVVATQFLTHILINFQIQKNNNNNNNKGLHVTVT